MPPHRLPCLCQLFYVVLVIFGHNSSAARLGRFLTNSARPWHRPQ